jgi:hypothetical protein
MTVVARVQRDAQWAEQPAEPEALALRLRLPEPLRWVRRVRLLPAE